MVCVCMCPSRLSASAPQPLHLDVVQEARSLLLAVGEAASEEDELLLMDCAMRTFDSDLYMTLLLRRAAAKGVEPCGRNGSRARDRSPRASDSEEEEDDQHEDDQDEDDDQDEEAESVRRAVRVLCDHMMCGRREHVLKAAELLECYVSEEEALLALLSAQAYAQAVHLCAKHGRDDLLQEDVTERVLADASAFAEVSSG